MPAVVSVQSADFTEIVTVFGLVPPRWSAVVNLIVPTVSLHVTTSFAASCLANTAPADVSNAATATLLTSANELAIASARLLILTDVLLCHLAWYQADRPQAHT